MTVSVAIFHIGDFPERQNNDWVDETTAKAKTFLLFRE
jgi:hypothetical protein